MKCPKCGSEIPEGASFCTACGAPVMNQNSDNDQTQVETLNVQNTSSNDVPNLFETESTNNDVNQTTPETFSSAVTSSDEASNLFETESTNNDQMTSQNQTNTVNNDNAMLNSFANQNPQNNMNNMGGVSNNNVTNHKKTPVGLIIGVIIIAIVIIAVFAGISLSKNDENKDNDTPDTNIQTTVDDNNQENQTNTDTKTVTYGNYTFTVPADYEATPSTSQLLITSPDNNLAEAIIYQSGTGYDTLSSMKDQVISALKAQENSDSYDFTSAVTTENTYNGTRFLITSGIKQGAIDLDITYAETDGGVFVVSIAKNNGAINETDRKELYAIVASANQSDF